MKKSQLAIVSAIIKSKVQLILGFVLVPFGLLGLCVYLPDPRKYGIGLIVFMFILLFIGLLLWFFSLKTKKLISHFRLYVSILSNQSSSSVCELAMTVGDSEQHVMAELQAMIDRRFFAAAYIDRSKKLLVFPKLNVTVQEESTQSSEVVTCSICGGDNKIVAGQHSNCVFCGNSIVSDTQNH